MKKKLHVYRAGEYAYLAPKGEIVKILGSTKKEGWLRAKNVFRVVSLKDIDPFTGKPTQYFDCNYYALMPILDKDIQFLLKMAYNDDKFTIIRQLG